MSRLSNTTVRFIQGVPFDNNYAHTRWFTTRTEQFNYFNSFPKIERSQNNFQKSTGRMAIDVSEHVETMMKYDYLMYKNNNYGNKWFYAFILNVEYLDARTTRVYFEIDPIQTYMFDVDIKPSYVVREHESATDNIYPEGLQVGSEYEVAREWDVKPYPFYFMVVVTKGLIHDHIKGTEMSGTTNGIVDPLNYYFIPIARSTSGLTRFYGDDNYGDSAYVGGDFFSALNLTNFLQNSQTAVNNVVSIYVTDYLPVNVVKLVGDHFRINNARLVDLEPTPDVLPQKIFQVDSEFNQTTDLPDLTINVGNIFSSFSESQSKLKYYPYTIVELSDGRGNVVTYKPEGFIGSNGQLRLQVLGSLSIQNNVVYGLRDYKGFDSKENTLQNGLINNDPQDLAILNNQTASYLQGAKNSMQAKQNTWSSQRSYQMGSAITRTATNAGKLLGGGVGMGMGGMGLGYGINALSEGIGGMVQSGLDFNYTMTEYQNRIAEQNAQVEDLMNVPPSIQKQGNAPSLNIGYNMYGVRVKIKRIQPQYLERARSYMHMFGTKTNHLKRPNLRSRTHFNYVQTTMLNVQSDFYNDDIQRFKQIFDSGITLWHTNDIYNYNVSNNRR